MAAATERGEGELSTAPTFDAEARLERFAGNTGGGDSATPRLAIECGR
jgi:hypothetical protein